MSIWLRITLAGAAIALFLGGASLCNWQYARRLEGELETAEGRIEQMGIEHRDTLEAMSKAMETREAIHERARIMEERLCKAIDKDPLCGMRLSDDLRLRLLWNENSKIPAAGNPAAGHSDTGTEKH